MWSNVSQEHLNNSEFEPDFNNLQAKQIGFYIKLVVLLSILYSRTKFALFQERSFKTITVGNVIITMMNKTLALNNE